MQKVSFPHHTVKLVGNLFLPANFDKTKKYPAIVVTHPFGGVKEQAAGLYAKKLAEQGFITLAFDASHYGESGGEPRQAEVPADRVEDIRSAVDYLKEVVELNAAIARFPIHGARLPAGILALSGVEAPPKAK